MVCHNLLVHLVDQPHYRKSSKKPEKQNGNTNTEKLDTECLVIDKWDSGQEDGSSLKIASKNSQEFVQQYSRVANGWKPGAISKRLLSKLKKAKRQRSAVESSKPTRRHRKRTENKPTLIVCKVNGEYRVEMQTTPENNEGNNNEPYTPLVYKIAKANNKDKLAKLELKKRRLVKEMIGNFIDPYHPEFCENTCLKAYKQAIGSLPYDPNNPECTRDEIEQNSCESCYCDYDDVSSDCSSMDIDWEIHFSPPIASHS